MEPDQNSRILAAFAHASSVVGLAMFAPAVVWLMYRGKPGGEFAAYHALQATVFHVAAFALIMVTAFCTFGLSTILLLPWFAFDLWMAWRAYEGAWAGYPGMSGLGRPADAPAT
jgi:hypothetical protein